MSGGTGISGDLDCFLWIFTDRFSTLLSQKEHLSVSQLQQWRQNSKLTAKVWANVYRIGHLCARYTCFWESVSALWSAQDAVL